MSEEPVEGPTSPFISAEADRNPQTAVLAESGRVEAFSDGVLAIAITLLVLGLRPPVTRDAMLQELVHQWPGYVAYAASFCYLGVLWVNHHQMFTRIAAVDNGLVWRNLALLGIASVLPFPTAVLSGAFQDGSRRDEKVGVVFYALIAAALSVTWIAVFQYLATNARLLADNASAAFFARERGRSLIGLATFLIAGLAALWQPIIGLVLALAMTIFFGATSHGLPDPRTRSSRRWRPGHRRS